MDLKKVPFLPLHYFYVLFEKFQKGLFLFLLACLIGAGLWTLGGSIWPAYFSLEIQEVAETDVEQVLIQEVQHHYRSFDFSLNAFRQWVNFSAGPILPKSGLVYAFIFFQVVAWTVFLAAASEIKSRWAYLFFLLYAIFSATLDPLSHLFSDSGLSAALGNSEILMRTIKFLIVLPPIVLALLFQMNSLRWSLGWKLLAFGAWNVLLMAIPFYQGGWESLHRVSTDGYIYYVALSLLFFFFLGKEPTKILFAAATNRPQKNTRVDYRLILGFCIVLLTIEFFWLVEYVNFGILPEFELGFRPIYLIVGSAILMVFTSQNHFHQVKEIFSVQANFVFILLSWALIVMSFMGYQYALGDPLMKFTLERAAVIFFFSMGLLHTLFVFANHLPLLKAKVNLYYLMANGRGKFEFWLIWTVGIVSIIAAGGFENWKSWNLFQHTYFNQEADHELIQGNIEKAQEYYELARGNSQVSPKANYNLASILVANPYKVGDAVRYYQDATKLIEFPYARINAAALLAVNNQATDAKRILKAARKVSPLVENNLGLLFLKEEQADSAIVHFQKALLANPEISAIYSNLSLLYLDQGFLKEAHEFMQAADESSLYKQSSQSNQLFFQLKHPELYFLPQKSPQDADLFYRYNQALLHLQQDPKQGFETEKIKALLSESQMQSPEILLLDGIRLFHQDSIKYAMTRIDYINEAFPNYADEANYILAVEFYQRNIPEMARKYFRQAGEAGLDKALLHAAQMEIELQRPDSANVQLALLSVQAEELYDEIAKERAMLLLPYVKNDVYAAKMYDLDNLSINEHILTGIYADSLNQYITALNEFRTVQQLDSLSIAPYLELAKIYNKYEDTLAITNLEYGLSLQKDNPQLMLELAKSHLVQGNTTLAQSLFEKIDTTAGLSIEKLRFSAELALSKGDTVKAIEYFASLHGQRPLDQGAILNLCRIFNKQKNYEAGNALITEALENNTENAAYWYYYAVFSKAWNLEEDAAYGALKAIELTYLSQRKKEIEKEFSQEIRRTLSFE